MLDEAGRAQLEQLRQSWLLSLRAEHKSEKTRLTYRDAAEQFTGFLATPPTGLGDELAAAVESVRRSVLHPLYDAVRHHP